MSSSNTEIAVSAIVSVYNAERYLKGCLEDLLSQSIANQMEIIVVDSGSEQNEGPIVRHFQDKYNNIKYIRTAKRETVYEAWNRGIQLARGRYITNANADDRHRNDALEILSATLDQRPDIALVYADILVTETENETFEQCTPTSRFCWLDWDRHKLLEGKCFMGPQPMWRRSLHGEYGFFRSDFITSGDYEFWLRISQTYDFLHLPVILGLYLKSSASIEHSNGEARIRENAKILKAYRGAAESGTVLNRISMAQCPGKRAERAGSDAEIDISPDSSSSPAGLIAMAMDEYWGDNMERVGELLSGVMNSRVTDAALVSTSAKLSVELGDYQKALALIDHADPGSESLELNAIKVCALLGLGEIDEAARCLRASMGVAPDSAPLLTANGLLHLEEDETEASVRCFKRAIASSPDEADAHINLGVALLEQGHVAAAFAAAREGFLLANPTHSSIVKMTRIIECNAQIRAVERQQIDGLFTTVISAHPHNKVLLYQYISSLLADERYTRAIEYIEIAIVRFGFSDGILQYGMHVREKIGPIRLAGKVNKAGTLSLCVILGTDISAFVHRLAALKGRVDEIIAVAADTTEEVVQIAQVFGAFIYNLEDYPQFKDPWELAVRMARGESSLRLDLRGSSALMQ